MTKLHAKLRLVFLPFLLMAVSLIAIYTFLNWLLLIKLHLFSVNEEIVNVWIPLALPLIPILVWLRPRIGLLKLNLKRGDLSGLYMFMAWVAMAVPLVIAQAYLETASGTLTRLDTISRMEKMEPTKYYTLDSYFILKRDPAVKPFFNVSGRHNEAFNMHLYVALPILASLSDTATLTCTAWYGIKYQKQISNRLNAAEKEEKYKQFYMESLADFSGLQVSRFIYLDRIGNTDDHEGFNEAIRNNKRYSGTPPVVLIPVNEPFEARNGYKLAWIFALLGIGSAVWFVMLLIPEFDGQALEKFKNGHVEPEGSGREMYALFIPRKGFFITPVILYINVTIFMGMVFAGLGLMAFNADDLMSLGANYRPAVMNGEWWRLITNMFLHGGLMHLMANMYALFFVGFLLEPKLGTTRFVMAYMFTGIMASAASIWWHPATVSVGASGAIFGLYGIFLALLMTKCFPKQVSRPFLISTLVFVGYNLITGFTGGIDTAAHIGGLVSGFAAGWILSPQIRQQEKEVQEPPKDVQ